jgi:hypothetical protein
MVVTEIRERHDVESDAIDAVPTQGLRTHLEHDGADLALAHPGEECVDLARLRGGEPAHDREFADVALCRGAEPRDESELPEYSLEDVRGRGLAVGPRHPEGERRMLVGPVEPGRELAERSPRGIDDDDGKAEAFGNLSASPIREDRHSAGVTGGFRELRAVRSRTGHTDEEISGLHLVRAKGDPCQLDALERSRVLETELADETGEGSRRRMLRSKDRGDPIRQWDLFLTRSSAGSEPAASMARRGTS